MEIRHRDPACVIKVGDGRGFIIQHRVTISRSKPLPKGSRLPRFEYRRLVVTAAHCLPKFPPAAAMLHLHEKTYKRLLGNLDGSKKAVSAECLFADPIADVAVLGRPDYEVYGDQADAYFALTDEAPILRIAKARSGSGWVLSLDNRWVPTMLDVDSDIVGASLSIDVAEPGMSGSPVLNDRGLAVGIVALGMEHGKGDRTNEHFEGQPILSRNLPGWLLRA